MNITKEGEGLQAVLKVKVTSEDYKAGVEAALKDYRKKAKIDGFRPGTVPMGLVKKMYGTYVLVDEVNKLISTSLRNYISEEKLHILGEPLPSESEQKDIDWDKETEFEFSFDIGLAPEVSVSLSKKNKADYYKIVADEKMVNEQADALASRFGSQETVNDIQENDFIKGNLTQVGADEPHVMNAASLLLSKVATQSEIGIFTAAKKGDTITFNPKKAFENVTEVSSMLGVDKDNAELMEADYAMEITDVLRFKKSELNQDLFDKAFGEGVVSSEEEMKTKIKTDTEERMLINSDFKLFYDFRQKLVETNKMELPEVFLKRWLLETNKDNDKVTPAQIEEEFPLFLDDLKWQIISGKLIQDNEIKVGEEEIKEGAKEHTRQQFAQFGMMNPADEDLEKWSQEILKNRDEVNKLYETEIQKKLIAYFKETIKLNEKEVTLEEFNKMIEQKQ